VTAGEGVAERPKVRVVVLNWNGCAMLPACLDSVVALDYPSDRMEVVVVDNGSTDGSVDLVRSRYPGVVVVSHETNLGFAMANNRAVSGAASPYVALLNNDCRVHAGWLAALVDYLEDSPRAAGAGSLVLDWDGDRIDFAGAAMSLTGRGHQPEHGRPAAELPRHPSAQLFANGAAMLVRRDAFLDAGGFDERFFAYYEDVDLGWRLWILGWEVALVPSSIAYHRHHGTSRRIAPEQIEVLLARNALLMVIKNYGEEWLRRVLPVALLAVGEEIEREIGLPPRKLRISAADAFAGRDAAVRVATARQRVGQAIRALRARRSPDEAFRRLATDSRRRSAAARATALSDVLAIWPELLADRAALQERRRRSDDEIVPLFRLADVPEFESRAAPSAARALEAVASEARPQTDN